MYLIGRPAPVAVSPRRPLSTARTQAIRVDEIDRSADGHRVSTTIDGTEIFFECDEAPLSPSPEAFASLMLLPAMQTRRNLIVDHPLEATWLQNIASICDYFGQWWDYPRHSPLICDELCPPKTPGPRGAIACFSGGADSFYMQLKSKCPADYLLMVHGWDIHLDEPDRFALARQSLYAVAAELGKQPLVIRTNLSHHPTLRLVSWDRACGSGLAAVAHLLGDFAGTFLIPSSPARSEDPRAGSNWITDPLWSNGRVTILQRDSNITRQTKILALANEPLAQRHLRVCFEKKVSHTNCSRCIKCLRTMTILQGANSLNRFSVFHQTAPLAEIVSALPYLDPELIPRFKKMLDLDLPPDLRAAWRGVFKRTHERYHPSIARRAVRMVRRLAGKAA